MGVMHSYCSVELPHSRTTVAFCGCSVPACRRCSDSCRDIAAQFGRRGQRGSFWTRQDQFRTLLGLVEASVSHEIEFDTMTVILC